MTKKVGTLTDTRTGESVELTMGRPSGLTPDLHERIVDNFRKEASIQTVAAACGVARSTMFAWLAKGRSGHPRYVKFAQDVEAARNLHKSKWMSRVEEMAEGDSPHALRAALTLLARQFPDEWGDRDTVALDEHKTKKNESEFLKTLSPEELQFLKNINERRLIGDGDE